MTHSPSQGTHLFDTWLDGGGLRSDLRALLVFQSNLLFLSRAPYTKYWTNWNSFSTCFWTFLPRTFPPTDKRGKEKVNLIIGLWFMFFRNTNIILSNFSFSKPTESFQTCILVVSLRHQQAFIRLRSTLMTWTNCLVEIAWLCWLRCISSCLT